MPADKLPDLEITAYHRWLMMVTGGNELALAKEIASNAVYDRNPQAIHLIELAGDVYNTETFEKAAQILLAVFYENKELLDSAQ